MHLAEPSDKSRLIIMDASSPETIKESIKEFFNRIEKKETQEKDKESN